MFKYQNKRFCGYLNLKSRIICQSDAKLLNIEASACVSLDGVDASLKIHLIYWYYLLKYIFPFQLSVNHQ